MGDGKEWSQKEAGRLRGETQVGFKMVTWLCAIEFVADYRDIRGGGGSREDITHYEQAIPI